MHAVQRIHRQYSARRVLRIDARHDDAVVFAKQGSHPLLNRGFQRVIGLALQPRPQVVELVFRALPISVQSSRQEGEEETAKVLADGPGDARILNLDGDLFAALEAGAMDLSERS